METIVSFVLSPSFYLVAMIMAANVVFTITVPFSQGFQTLWATSVLLVNAAMGTYAWAVLIDKGIPLSTLAPAMGLMLPVVGVAVGAWQGEPLPAAKLLWLGAGGVCLLMAQRC